MSCLLNVFLVMPLSLGLLLGKGLKPMALLEDLGNEWAMERNNKRVKLRKRSIDILFNIIVEFVRLKLMGLILKGTPDVIKASKVRWVTWSHGGAGLWDCNRVFDIDDHGTIKRSDQHNICYVPLFYIKFCNPVFSKLSDLAAGTLYSSGWVSS
ncbi:hypothetical protein Tco_0063436 [Tanacetum coccineum]